jgi:hypothetical protein
LTYSVPLLAAAAAAGGGGGVNAGGAGIGISWLTFDSSPFCTILIQTRAQLGVKLLLLLLLLKRVILQSAFLLNLPCRHNVLGTAVDPNHMSEAAGSARNQAQWVKQQQYKMGFGGTNLLEAPLILQLSVTPTPHHTTAQLLQAMKTSRQPQHAT